MVIGTTGDCGSCTSTLIHDLIETERQGVPTVALVATTFIDDARETARVFGMPDLKIVRIPGPLTNLTRAEVEQVAEQIFPQVYAALTGAESDVEQEASCPRTSRSTSPTRVRTSSSRSTPSSRTSSSAASATASGWSRRPTSGSRRY